MNNIEDIKQILNEQICHFDEPMDKHTTFRVGGKADLFVTPTTKEELVLVVNFAKSNNIPLYIIGNGSNLLVSDNGIRGIVVQLFDKFNTIKLEKNIITACSGAVLSRIANLAKDNELTGFEFAAGIPGSFGGAIAMNAGAYGGEMKDVILTVDILEESGEVKTYTCEEMNFAYRHSVVTGTDRIVVGGSLQLNKGNMQDIINKMQELNFARITKQPLEYPSAGSTFKRPEGYFAGKLIMDSGLAGYSVGGAMVSPKHCGFVINNNNASANDVYTLINDVKRVVYEKMNVSLEEEVKIIGEF